MLLGIEKAVFAGHDWGGFVAWAMPVLYPERTLGVIGVNTPNFPVPTTTHYRTPGRLPMTTRRTPCGFRSRVSRRSFVDPRTRIVFEKLMRRDVSVEQAVAQAVQG